MPEVIAISSFDHYGDRRRGERFTVSEPTAKDLEQRNLVRRVNPPKAAGAKSPASQAAQASPAKTAKRSGRGGRRKKEGLSSQ